ncbi:uncharacterized protein LOC120067603 [Benincasa hispida]|uniref:uncharacterized protein LOC120067603 n=1 Tax=Benincasa hispida TaxID=102211 RepID=UPI001901C0C3|nr:uncharacterized protein LOC120067603 [Benincasa hispida]
MALANEEMTAFRTPKGIYCYKVMPFGLKNVGATYQRAMQKVFDNMLHKHVECYVDDLVVKTKRRQNHLKDLRTVFDHLRKYQLKMNPLKCAFGTSCLRSPSSGQAIDTIHCSAREITRGALLAQERVKGKEHTLYYLSRTLNGAEINYSPIKKTCLALFFAIDKLRHYIQAFTVHLIAKAGPIKYVLSRPIILGRLAKWAIMLQQYDIVYVPQRAVKGQVLVDFLAEHPVPSDWELSEDLPNDEVLFTETSGLWVMFFNDAARKSGAGPGIILILPEKHMLPYSFTLAELCSNNVVEYQALIIGLQMALEIGIACIEIFGDSKLIINQILCQYEVKHDNLKPYFTYARQLMEKFESVALEHVLRMENKKADALANLATTLTDLDNVPLNISLWRR